MKLLTILVVGMGWFANQAQAAVPTMQQMLQDMAAIEADSSKLTRALESGRERATLCVHCHGIDGNSKRGHIPNLASQNSEYLFAQFENFASGKRKDYVMSKLAAGLSPQDRIDVALYFSHQQVKPQEISGANNTAGEKLYNSVCFACHGGAGHGSAQYPRIAGQPYEFLQKALLRFLHNDSERENSPMTSVVKNLTEQQLNDVAAFVTKMP